MAAPELTLKPIHMATAVKGSSSDRLSLMAQNQPIDTNTPMQAWAVANVRLTSRASLCNLFSVSAKCEIKTVCPSADRVTQMVMSPSSCIVD